VGVRTVINHSEPFHRECRVYGRLKETNSEHVAVACYGYILLGDEYREEFRNICGDDWEDKWMPPQRGRPLKAIVKKYIENGDTPKALFPLLKENILAINRLGIFIADFYSSNCLAALPVDFSKAATVPDYKFEHCPKAYGGDKVVHDMAQVDIMIEDWNDEHPDDRYEDTLGGNLDTWEEVPGWKDPRTYDWEAAAKQRRTRPT
jgi:hypothetical protein